MTSFAALTTASHLESGENLRNLAPCVPIEQSFLTSYGPLWPALIFRAKSLISADVATAIRVPDGENETLDMFSSPRMAILALRSCFFSAEFCLAMDVNLQMLTSRSHQHANRRFVAHEAIGES